MIKQIIDLDTFDRTAFDVFEEIESRLKVELKDKDVDYDYCMLDLSFTKKCLFPSGTIFISASEGGNEGHLVSMMILEDGIFKSFLAVKTWTLNEALEISNTLTRMIYR